jgi:hypothetical protein
MSTLSICDRVMVVLDGKLDAFASLSELTDSNDYYRFASGMATPAPPRNLDLDLESFARGSAIDLASDNPSS